MWEILTGYVRTQCPVIGMELKSDTVQGSLFFFLQKGRGKKGKFGTIYFFHGLVFTYWNFLFCFC